MIADVGETGRRPQRFRQVVEHGGGVGDGRHRAVGERAGDGIERCPSPFLFDRRLAKADVPGRGRCRCDPGAGVALDGRLAFLRATVLRDPVARGLMVPTDDFESLDAGPADGLESGRPNAGGAAEATAWPVMTAAPGRRATAPARSHRTERFTPRSPQLCRVATSTPRRSNCWCNSKQRTKGGPWQG